MIAGPGSGSRILVVEDEQDVRDLILLRLQREGYAAEPAATGQGGLVKMQKGNFDLFVLDWMLPGVSGLDLVRVLRQDLKSQTPVLMVTARVEASDIVLGLEAGADDYITKPFEIPVLLARVRALLRRATLRASTATVEQIRVGELEIDLGAHEVRCGGAEIALTMSEFKLLATLVQNRGRVLTRDQLIDQVRGIDVSIVSRAIDTHVFGLRKKLGACAEVIETIRGVGYRVKGT